MPNIDWSAQQLGVIGAGVMGRALINGIVGARLLEKDQIWAAVKSQNSQSDIEEQLGVRATTQLSDFLPQTTALLLCVKPKNMHAVLAQLQQSALPPSCVVMSIVAGVTTQQMASGIAAPNPIIRVMTNTPCLIGQGMSVISPGATAKAEHIAMAHEIFESVGVCLTLDESHLNAVTALSGAGPAYFYLMMEALADGGVRVGLPRDVALRLVSQTALGAAMMVQASERHPAALRDDVTTPAGCTIGGLLALEDGKIRSVLARAVEEATQIANQLG